MVDSSASSIALGCTVAVGLSAIQSLGITLQRKSHLLINPHTSNYHHHQKHKRNMWLFGFFLFIVANIFGSLIQITTLPLIILSPLQSIGLIFNSILSCMMLPGEKFTKKLGWGTVIISVGAFIIAYQGTTPSEGDGGSGGTGGSADFDDVLRLLLKKSFLSWFVCTFVGILVLLIVNYLVTKRRRTLKEIQTYETTSLRTSIKIQRALNKYQFVKGVNYGIISGTLTAHTFLFAKSLIDVVIQAILDKGLSNLFSVKNFTPYLLLIIMLCIIGCQLTAFNLGLSQILTAILYPLCFLVYNLMNLINDLTFNSLIVDKKMTYGQLAWILFGLGGVLFGVVLISWDAAFGGKDTGSKKLKILEGTPDEIIMQLKFPYTSSLCDETTELLTMPGNHGNSIGSGSVDTVKPFSSEEEDQEQERERDAQQEVEVNTTGEYSDEVNLMSSYNSIGPLPKRVLSFEQTQLLSSLDF